MDIEQALGSLPDDQRAAIVLVDVEGYSVADAAISLSVAQGTVKSRCARGRAKLAVSLGHLRNPDAVAGVEPPDTRRPGMVARAGPWVPRSNSGIGTASGSFGSGGGKP